MLKDTSIAAVSLPNGDRNIFFQETNGGLRHAIYSSEGKAWATDFSKELSLPFNQANARHRSPLATVDSYFDGIFNVCGP